MNTLVSSAHAQIARQTERQLTDHLRAMTSAYPMTDTDRWLYSVWEGQPDWMLFENALSADSQRQNASALPTLLGCLQCCRQPELTARQAKLLAIQQKTAYQQMSDLFSQRQYGLLNGGSAILHYLALANVYSNGVPQESSSVMHWTMDGNISFEPFDDLSLGTGQTGWALTLVRLIGSVRRSKRICMSVREPEAAIAQYVDYLLAHQLPVDAENYSFFPTFITGVEWEVSDAVSWATGDVGQLLLLYQAGTYLQRLDLIEWANRLSGYVLQRRRLDRMKNHRLGLIDGAAGLSLTYRQLYLLTNRRDFLIEGYYWLDQLIKRVQAGEYGTDQSLLTGTLGVNGAIRQWLGDDTGLDLLFL